MKKALFILLLATTFVACQKEDENGDLSAFWKILEIEDHSTGETINLTEESHFWSIQLNLLEIRQTEEDITYCRFQHTGDSLMVQAVEPQDADLKLWGIYDNTNERYKVLLLNSKNMILNSKYAKIIFKHF